MCTVSMIGSDFQRTIPGKFPWLEPHPPGIFPNTSPNHPFSPAPSREEFEALKFQVEALKKMLSAAKEYDAATGQPDCEMDEKVEYLRRIANWLGVDLSDVFPEES